MKSQMHFLKLKLWVSVLLFYFSADAHIIKPGCNSLFPDTFRIGNKTLLIEQCTEEEYNKLPISGYDDDEQKNIANDASLVHRNGDTLYLTAFKKVILINNNRSELFTVNFVYMGLTADSAFYFITVNQWESSSCILVSRITGEQFHLSGTPMFSPDKHYVICSKFFINSFDEAGFELYKIDKDKLIKIGEFIPKNWAPLEIKWLDNSTFRVRIWLNLTNTRNEYRVVKII